MQFCTTSYKSREHAWELAQGDTYNTVATNQKVGEQNRHGDQKCNKQDIGSWIVEEISPVEGVLKIKLAN